MTATEVIAELNDMPAHGDEESLHGRADELLCEVLEQSGLADVAKAFREARSRVPFWYA